jgi:hypothetical protein
MALSMPLELLKWAKSGGGYDFHNFLQEIIGVSATSNGTGSYSNQAETLELWVWEYSKDILMVVHSR